MVREVRRTINELIRAYDDMPTRHSRDALLSAIFDLNAWYVIELGEGENRPPCIAWEEEEQGSCWVGGHDHGHDRLERWIGSFYR